MRVLAVDDSEDCREVIEVAFLSAGYRDVVTAQSASEALDILDFWGPSAEVKFDVVLLDVCMPKIDGIETCARIRTEARFAKLPIIMLTSLRDTKSLVDAFAAGATDYVAKPFTCTGLVARAKAALKS
jgi:sigma-B regulation protein RsbU (phosphoserine phosphatase)